MIKTIRKYLTKKLKLVDEIRRNKSVDIIESEIVQLEHIFSILAFGQFIGIPSSPTQISLDLLPVSEKSVALLVSRMSAQNEPLAELASVFRID
jgi:hypothetical protein